MTLCRMSCLLCSGERRAAPSLAAAAHRNSGATPKANRYLIAFIGCISLPVPPGESVRLSRRRPTLLRQRVQSPPDLVNPGSSEPFRADGTNESVVHGEVYD
jgi:hypothetical protein